MNVPPPPVKTYPTLLVASAITGTAMTKTTFSEMQEVLTHLSGLDIFTHEMGHGETMDRIRGYASSTFPDMPTKAEAKQDWRAAAAKAVAAYGEAVEVPRGTLTREKHPIETLMEMKPGKKPPSD